MKNYYVSKYLNIIELGETYLLFNGFNGCIDEVSKNLGDYLIKNVQISDSNSISDKEISFLLKRGHLTTLSEKKEVEKFKSFASKLDQYNLQSRANHGSLMLLLSYSCNLDCYYCYQRPIRDKKAKEFMTKDTVDMLFTKNFEKLFGNISKNNIDITLYGGEPFLKQNREVVQHVLKYAKNYSLYVGAISNCTQLEHYIDLLGPLPGMINFIQVSIDGDQENHDKSRVHDPSIPTFDTILKNIHIMLDKKVKLNIRINIEVNSLNKVTSLYKLLKEEEILDHPYAYVYLHPLHNHFSQADDSSFIGHEETAVTLERLDTHGKIRHPIRRKAEGLAYLMNFDKGIAFKKTRFCMQNLPNNYLIDPYGDLYGCYEEAGRDDLKIGTLTNKDITYTPLREKYLKRSILSLDKCLSCSVALLCGGECSVQAREINGDIFDPYCGSRKSEIFEAIKYIYKERKVNNEIDNLNLLFPNL